MFGIQRFGGSSVFGTWVWDSGALGFIQKGTAGAPNSNTPHSIPVVHVVYALTYVLVDLCFYAYFHPLMHHVRNLLYLHGLIDQTPLESAKGP